MGRGEIGIGIWIGVLQLVDPGGGGGYLLEVELLGMDELLEGHITIVALDDVGLGLDGADNLANLCQLLARHLGSLVQQDGVAELNLLDDQILNILLVDVGAQQVVAALELVAHTQGIDHRNHAVELQIAVLDILGTQLGDADNGLGNGTGLADAAGLDDDIVEAVHGQDVLQLLDEVHLQGAADAAVLQGYQGVVLLAYHPTLLNEVGIDVHLADIVYNDSKLDTLLVLKDTIEQCGLSAA